METKLIMKNIKQKQVVDVIKKNNFFNKKDFDFTPSDNNNFEIIYRPIPEYRFSINGDTYKGVPGSGGNPVFKIRFNGWENGLRGMEVWLNYVQQNIVVGNPWAEEEETIKDFFAENNSEATQELLSREDQKVFAEKIDLLLDRLKGIDVDVTKISVDMEDLKRKSSEI